MKFFVINVIFLLILHLNCIQLVKAQEKVNDGNSTDTITCYHCNNKLNSNCLNNLKESRESDNFKCTTNKIDGCITYIDPNDKYLYRNCKKDAPPQIVCSDSNSDTCKTCQENDYCNNEENFPKDKRQKCYVCKGNDENCFLLKPEKLKPEYCPEYPDKCFTYVKDDNTTIRDCLSKKNLSNDICPNSKECIECEKSKCNNESGVIELKCYECSGDDGECKRTEEKDNCLIDSKYNKLCGTILLGRDEPKDVCYIKKNGNYVERGCYLTKNSTIFVERNSTLEKYKSEENGICIMDLECIQCKSDNEKCGTDSDDLKNFSGKCDKYVTSCYRYDDKDGKTTRGCKVPSNDQIQTTSFCYESKCIAKKLKVECYSCDSENDENCAQLKNITALKINECDDNDECATIIKKNGHTVRGCKKIISPDQDCTNNQLCQICSPKLTDATPCNGNVFPFDRRQCYQCNNCNDIILNDQQQKSYPCHIYKKDDQCYMYTNNNNDIVRGCISDTKSSDDCTKAKEKCYKCDESSCNYHGKMKDPSIKCIKCNSEFNDDCKWGYNQNQAINCMKQLEFWKMEKCYVCNTNGKITRGCESDLNPDVSNECKICAADGCNNYHEKNFTCIRCRSDNEGQESCAQNAESIKPSNCVYPVSKSNRGCFTDRNVNTGVVVRGCLVDLYVTDRSKCLDNTYEYCQNCLESNCNNQEISGSIKTVTISIINIILSIFIINFII